MGSTINDAAGLTEKSICASEAPTVHGFAILCNECDMPLTIDEQRELPGNETCILVCVVAGLETGLQLQSTVNPCGLGVRSVRTCEHWKIIYLILVGCCGGVLAFV